MHPSVAFADEVGVNAGNFEVVGVPQFLFALDGNDTAAFPFELVDGLAGHKLGCCHPAPILHMERMLGRGADDLGTAIGRAERYVENLPVVTP